MLQKNIDWFLKYEILRFNKKKIQSQIKWGKKTMFKVTKIILKIISKYITMA